MKEIGKQISSNLGVVTVKIRAVSPNVLVDGGDQVSTNLFLD